MVKKKNREKLDRDATRFFGKKLEAHIAELLSEFSAQRQMMQQHGGDDAVFVDVVRHMRLVMPNKDGKHPAKKQLQRLFKDILKHHSVTHPGAQQDVAVSPVNRLLVQAWTVLGDIDAEQGLDGPPQLLKDTKVYYPLSIKLRDMLDRINRTVESENLLEEFKEERTMLRARGASDERIAEAVGRIQRVLPEDLVSGQVRILFQALIQLAHSTPTDLNAELSRVISVLQNTPPGQGVTGHSRRKLRGIKEEIKNVMGDVVGRASLAQRRAASPDQYGKISHRPALSPHRKNRRGPVGTGD